MSPETHRQAGEWFARLRELPDDQLTAALDRGCAGNSEVRAQVLRLIAADRKAARGFLESPAVEEAAKLLVPDGAGLPAAGTVIGNYRVGERIGAGGMGVVYEGQDLHLGRRVALKILPLGFGEAEERVRRFQREARAASTLNHPHIVAIFDADSAEGYHYIAMEFVEGQTLRQIIREGKPLDSQKILDWIGQTAAVLGAAHEAGIVHRDIKPENIMIRPDGFVKVLDFGLAKLREPVSGAQHQPDFLTKPGSLAGTIHYLSPEQILGQPAGPLSDLFSLGVVAYELAAGIQPFDGPTDGAVIDAILHHVPQPPSAVRPPAGPDLDALVMRAIEKDPELRFQTAEDLRSTCRRISRNSGTSAEKYSAPGMSSGVAPAARAAGRRFAWWLPAGATAALLLAAAVWFMRPLPPVQLSRIVQITNDGLGKEQFVNDGTRIYFRAGSGPQQQMYQVSVREGKPVPMPGLNGMFPLDISPDRAELLLGQELPDTANGPYPLWVATTVGGALRRLGDLRAQDAHWSPKGDEIVYTVGSELRIARSDGSASRQLAVVNGSPESPVWSPNGRLIRFTVLAKNSETLWEVAADGRRPHALLPGWRNWPHRDGVWTTDGRYFIFSARRGTRDLWALPEAGDPFRPAPAPVRLTTGPLSADRPETSPDNHRLFFLGGLNRAELVRYDPKLGQWIPYLGGLPALQLDYSRDGKWVTYTSYTDRTVWRSAVDGSQQLQLTAPPMLAVKPCWSPDGTQVAFFGGASGEPSRIYAVSAGGGRIQQLSHGEMGPGGDADPSWSPDGRELVFGGQSTDPQSRFELELIDLKSHGIRKLPGSEGLWSPRWSPDGVWIAALEFPLFKLCLYNVRTHGRQELTDMGVGWPAWSADSQSIYFEDNRTTAWFRVNIKDGKVERLASLSALKFAPTTLGWIGLTPGGSPISARDAGSTEIYALDLEGP